MLGTAAQSPTTARNQTAHVVRWGSEVVLFDPGEGTQRQLAYAGIPVSQLTRICITHAHGDHCLGLPGVLQRRSGDPDPAPLDVHFPASMAGHVDALLASTAWDRGSFEVHLRPTDGATVVDLGSGVSLQACPLDHTVDALGWRVELAAARHVLPERLAAAGLTTEDAASLRRDGVVVRGGTPVRFEDVSLVTAGPAFAFVMDTRPCDGARELLRDVDLAVVESTYLDADEHLAGPHGHCTASQAARLAAEAGVRRLVLAHYSERHPDEQAFADEAGRFHGEVIAARDLDVIRPPRDAAGDA